MSTEATGLLNSPLEGNGNGAGAGGSSKRGFSAFVSQRLASFRSGRERADTQRSDAVTATSGSPGGSFCGEPVLNVRRIEGLSDGDPDQPPVYRTLNGDFRMGMSGRESSRSRQPTGRMHNAITPVASSAYIDFDLTIGAEFLGPGRNPSSFRPGAATMEDLQKHSRLHNAIQEVYDDDVSEAETKADGDDDDNSVSTMSNFFSTAGLGAPRLQSDAKLGTLTGVFFPCMSAICNSILFVRHPWVYGQFGLVWTEVMMLACALTTTLTALSMSAVATNGCVRSGGTYFMISRTLGPAAGGAVGISFYLATCLSIPVNFLGAVEIIMRGFEVRGYFDLNGWDHFLVAAAATVPCLIIVLCGAHYVTRAIPMFVVCAQIGILSMWSGLLSDWNDTTADCEMTGADNCTSSIWTDNQLADNLWPALTQGTAWTQVFGIYFSSATGITAGANLCASLKNPQKSIPRGTLCAIGYAYILYAVHALLFCMAVGRGLLTNLEENASHTVAFPYPWVVKCASVAATLAAGQTAMAGAPRMLQGIAWDRVLPILDFVREDPHHEPRKAVLFTWLLSMCFMMMGNLNSVTPFCTLFYLMFYAFANAACCVLFVMRAPNFRPQFGLANTYTSGAGFVMCIVGMFVVNALFASICLAFSVAVSVYIGVRGQQKGDEWGDAWFDLRWYTTRKSLLKLDQAGPMHYKNWRPNLMLLTKVDVTSGTPYFQEEELVTFLSHLRHARGLQIMGTVVELDVINQTFHNDGAMAHNPRAYTLDYVEVRDAISSLCHARKMKCFTQVVASAVDTGISNVIQTAGVGRFQPNIVVMGWPWQWKQNEKTRRAFLSALRTCDLLHKALLVLQSRAGSDRPSAEYPVKPQHGQTIDIWWNPHSGGLLLLIAHLIHQHRSWRGCAMRCFSLVYPGSDHCGVLASLEIIFAQLRLECEVSIVEFDGDEIVGSWSGKGSGIYGPSGFAANFTNPAGPSVERTGTDRGTPMSPGDYSPHLRSGKYWESTDDMFLSLPRQNSMIDDLSHLPTYKRLNKLMAHYSRDAALVCMNLPRPSQTLLHGSPRESLLTDYLGQIDTLTANLPATILIRDSGHDNNNPTHSPHNQDPALQPAEVRKAAESRRATISEDFFSPKARDARSRGGNARASPELSPKQQQQSQAAPTKTQSQRMSRRVPPPQGLVLPHAGGSMPVMMPGDERLDEETMGMPFSPE